VRNCAGDKDGGRSHECCRMMRVECDLVAAA
jgi:hypothetical protein